LNDPRKASTQYAFTVALSCVVAGASCSGKASGPAWPIGTNELFFTSSFHDISTPTASDIKWDGPAFVAGELIIGFADSESVRCQLRKSELPTAVDKAVGISNLNHDFRLRA
jgi:hypothetical protein